ncbi:MAG: GTP cyclohydrolase I [Nanopusillaceae archaeon]
MSVLVIANSQNFYEKVDLPYDEIKRLKDVDLFKQHITEEKETAFYDIDRDYGIDYDTISDLRLKTKQIFEEWFKLLNIDSFVPHQHTEDTPSRLSRMYINELMKYAFEPTPKITTFKNVNGDGLVKLENIEINSLCAHHLVPFIGKASIAYIPNEKLLGLSKLPRLCQFFAYKPSIQEELTIDTINYIYKIIEPKAIYYTMTCEHLCMKIRGVKSDSITTTSKYLGDRTYYDLLVKGG